MSYFILPNETKARTICELAYDLTRPNPDPADVTTAWMGYVVHPQNGQAAIDYGDLIDNPIDPAADPVALADEYGLNGAARTNWTRTSARRARCTSSPATCNRASKSPRRAARCFCSYAGVCRPAARRCCTDRQTRSTPAPSTVAMTDSSRYRANSVPISADRPSLK